MRFSRRILMLGLIAAVVIPVVGTSPAQATTKRCVSGEVVEQLFTTQCQVRVPNTAWMTLKWNVKSSAGFALFVNGFYYLDNFSAPRSGSLTVWCSPNCYQAGLQAYGIYGLGLLTVTF